MVKITIEADGYKTLVMEGQGIVGSVFVEENEDGSVEVDDITVGDFNLHTLTSTVHSSVTMYMKQLAMMGFTQTEIDGLVDIIVNRSHEASEEEVKAGV